MLRVKSWFKNAPLAHKIVCINGSILFILIVSMLFVAWEAAQSRHFIHVQAASLEKSEAMSKASNGLSKLRFARIANLLTLQDRFLDQAEEAKKQILAAMDADEQTAKWLTEYNQIMDDAAAAFLEGDRLRTNERVSGATDVAQHAHALVSQRLSDAKSQAEEAAVAVSEKSFRLVAISIILILVSALVSISLSWRLVNAVTEPVLELSSVVRAAAEGDLRGRFEIERNDEIGDLARAFTELNSATVGLINHLKESSTSLTDTANSLVSSSQQQQSGASQQASAVQQTKRTMEQLLASANKIADTGKSVLDNAQLNQKNNQQISRRINDLVKATDRIATILESIKEIANKSDLLALNAALEGTKAGEAGRGFSLVATQMQRLAEQVMGSVHDIKTLTADIQASVNATVLATDEATKIAEENTSAARQISLAVGQQQTGTQQVAETMSEIASVAKEFVGSSSELLATANALSERSDQMSNMVARFKVAN